MKKGILILLLAASAGANAQSLKEALYGGKLKTQPGSIIRKGDDLSTKMDTTQNAAFNATLPQTAPRVLGDSTQTTTIASDSTAIDVTEGTTTVQPATTETIVAATPATNASIWKTYIDSVASDVKRNITESKKVKRGDYSVTVTYAIETDGETTITDVFVAPDNDYIKQQIRSRLSADLPRLSPVLNSAGAPRKLVKRQTFALSKS